MRRIRYQMPIYQEIASPGQTASFVTGPLAAQMAEGNASFPVVASNPDRPTQPHAVVAMQLDDEDDMAVPRPPTLSARAVKTVIFIGSRAISWVWRRTHARAERQ